MPCGSCRLDMELRGTRLALATPPRGEVHPSLPPKGEQPLHLPDGDRHGGVRAPNSGRLAAGEGNVSRRNAAGKPAAWGGDGGGDGRGDVGGGGDGGFAGWGPNGGGLHTAYGASGRGHERRPSRDGDSMQRAVAVRTVRGARALRLRLVRPLLRAHQGLGPWRRRGLSRRRRRARRVARVQRRICAPNQGVGATNEGLWRRGWRV
mmetsp:Transcript_40410/g.130841  ORF Transcript_40410/g.130841 Transcript_40410/m.130841 type:complete len:206 (-) Transcript_40410:381-998(-)